MTSYFLPDASRDEMGWFNDLQRISAPAENAARLLGALGEFNVLDLLPGIAAPTLVLHCRGDVAVPFDQGQLRAAFRGRDLLRSRAAITCCCRVTRPGPVSSARCAGFLAAREQKVGSPQRNLVDADHSW